MQIKCKVENKQGMKCDKILISKKEKPDDAFKDLITQLEIHLKGRHNSQLEEYKEDLKDIQAAANALPAWMLINAFIDCDSSDTSEEFKKGYEELDDLLEPIAELFEIDSSQDNVELEEEKEDEEKEFPYDDCPENDEIEKEICAIKND